MENNKLIAEFMSHGFHDGKHRSFDELQYHKSWDWLMPVVQKCFEVAEHEDDFFAISGNLPYMDSTYKAVVEFINEHNKYICGSCGDHVNEVVFNEDTDVDECTNCIQ